MKTNSRHSTAGEGDGVEPTQWLGDSEPVAQTQNDSPASADGAAAFNDGLFWIGRHDHDEDILVFDPAESDPFAPVLSLYSLTQHRKRSFPRAVVSSRIQALTDQISLQRAKKEYEDRASRLAAHNESEAAARLERLRRQKEGVIDAHREYLTSRGLEYRGVEARTPEHRTGRRTKCHSCEAQMTDYMETVCTICSAVLCTCGACACGSTPRRRSKKQAAAD